MLTLAVVLFSGWLLAATLGTWTWFAAQNPSRTAWF
jgi:hypothetical protein